MVVVNRKAWPQKGVLGLCLCQSCPSVPFPAFEKGHCYEPHLQNGNFTTSDATYNLGTIVEFTCDPGHTLEQGPAVIQCINLRDPYWNDTEPLCRGGSGQGEGLCLEGGCSWRQGRPDSRPCSHLRRRALHGGWGHPVPQLARALCRGRGLHLEGPRGRGEANLPGHPAVSISPSCGGENFVHLSSAFGRDSLHFQKAVGGSLAACLQSESGAVSGVGEGAQADLLGGLP